MGGPGSGRRRLPVEDHLRRGTYRADRHGPRPPLALSPVSKPSGAFDPQAPGDLAEAGRRLWTQACHPDNRLAFLPSDLPLLELVAHIADDLELARQRYRETAEPAAARVLVSLAALKLSLLADLGLTPLGRRRLGLDSTPLSSELSKLDLLRMRRRDQFDQDPA